LSFINNNTVCPAGQQLAVNKAEIIRERANCFSRF